MCISPRWGDAAAVHVHFSFGIYCLASSEIQILCVLNSVKSHINQTKPHQLHAQHTPTRSTAKQTEIHKYSVAVLSFRQFITDRAVIWLGLFGIASHLIRCNGLSSEFFLVGVAVSVKISE